MQLIDTHVHINFDVFQADLEALQQRWKEAGVVRLVHSCVEPSEFPKTQALADRLPELSFAVGLHPLDAHQWTADTADQIREFACADSRVVAIGELGLDYYKAENQAHQRDVCQAQLEIAADLDKPVIIHCRDAASDLRELLQQQKQPPRGVMHCWGGTPEETAWFLDLGFYISFSGIVTFKNAKAVQESAKIVPRDRLLIETDCPFLAPVPKRGKRNEPANVRYVAETLAQLRQEDLDTLAQTTTANACQLFGLPQPTP
ncbi:TatD family hydrolase [Spirulina sp. CS-785/01]|uniref:TatD family hydrolase n=1 Tax=Spirulina sp. CS-785/01 TaxID=3021716 RepID=UPI00232BDC79|nr:TatD family hydrolase [Spirulina sp. CS-785/01]MDB9312893.1 TatD family hydrolase [Spirulina sp. CS-785/01]